MKNQAIQYLALDVHQATTVATVRKENGAICMRATVATEATAILGLLRGLGGRVHVVFEEGTQAQWLHDVVQPQAERVVVCNVRGRSETTNKSDRIDADWLSEQLRLGALKSVYHGSPSVGTLKELVRCYTNLVEDSTRVMLRVKAIFRGRAIGTSGEAVYRPSQRAAWLARLEGRGARTRAASLLAQLDVLLELRAKARAAMIAEARRQSGWKTLLAAVLRAGARCADPGHHRDAVPLPRETPPLAVCGTGVSDAVELRAGVCRGEAAPAEARTAHAWMRVTPLDVLPDVRDLRFGGESQKRTSARQPVTPRHSPNHSLLRMT